MSDVSDKPIIHSAEFIDGKKGLKSLVVEGYVPPLDGSHDQHREADIQIAHDVAAVLVKKYFAYEWLVQSEIKSGVVTFQIAELMGRTLRCAINLRTTEVTPDLIMRLGGEVLERMGLPRGQVEMGMIKAAKLRRHTFDFSDTLKRKPA